MKHIGIHEFNNLNDYDSLIVSGEITMKKCKVAAEILHNEHFSRSEDSKDFERYLAWTYRTSESLMEILLDYIDEMEDIISDLSELVNEDIKIKREMKESMKNETTKTA